jgi:hypothetical protein
MANDDTNLRLVPMRVPSRASITISPSADPRFVVLEMTHGYLAATVVVEEVQLLDLRPAPAPKPQERG